MPSFELLLPFFAFFYEPHVAVAATAVVHLLNNLLKVVLVGHAVSRPVLMRFVLPAIPLAFLGAWLLKGIAERKPVATWSLGEHTFEVTPTVEVLETGALAKLFESSIKAPRFVDERQ